MVQPPAKWGIRPVTPSSKSAGLSLSSQKNILCPSGEGRPRIATITGAIEMRPDSAAFSLTLRWIFHWDSEKVNHTLPYARRKPFRTRCAWLNDCLVSKHLIVKHLQRSQMMLFFQHFDFLKCNAVSFHLMIGESKSSAQLSLGPFISLTWLEWCSKRVMISWWHFIAKRWGTLRKCTVTHTARFLSCALNSSQVNRLEHNLAAAVRAGRPLLPEGVSQQ